MYVIGITPGVYQIARAAGVEASREFAGIEEKLRYGYTVGCNFFQIDQETFGEFVEPNIIRRISRLIQEMNIQWALHGLLIGEVYQTLESINFLSWKLSHLILHRDLIFLYEILQNIKKNKYPKEVFPHYTIYHASKEIVVGYALFREKEAFSQVLTTTPEGSINWDEFLDSKKRPKLRKWFLENVLEILFRRDILRKITRLEPSPLTLAVLNLIFIPYRDNKISENQLQEILKNFFSELKIEIEINNLISELRELKNGNISFIDENIIIARFFQNLINLSEKISNKVKVALNLLEKELEKLIDKKIIEEIKIKTLENSYTIYKDRVQSVTSKSAILYEDVAMTIVCKDVEFGAIDENYQSFLSNKTCRFLIERLLEKNLKENVIEEHVKETYEKFGLKKELIDIENLEINLTQKLNVLASIVYSISHFLISIDKFPEILDETGRRVQHLEEKDKIIEFTKLNAFEKLDKIVKELRELGIDREEAFFIAIENPESSPPYEGLRRICRLKDVFISTEALNIEFRERTKNSEKVFATCIDTEHLLSNAFNIENEINEVVDYVKKHKNDIYSRIAIYHIGVPKPYFGTTHIPFDIGSDEQFLIYEYCFKLREAGFTEEKINNKERYSYLIFERGGGQLPYQFLRTVIIALRTIKKYLEMHIDPHTILKKKEYYSEFFGFDEQFIREREIILKHAKEPLKGLIVWPEETYTILGKEVIEKFRKKPEEWVSEELK